MKNKLNKELEESKLNKELEESELNTESEEKETDEELEDYGRKNVLSCNNTASNVRTLKLHLVDVSDRERYNALLDKTKDINNRLATYVYDECKPLKEYIRTLFLSDEFKTGKKTESVVDALGNKTTRLLSPSKVIGKELNISLFSRYGQSYRIYDYFSKGTYTDAPSKYTVSSGGLSKLDGLKTYIYSDKLTESSEVPSLVAYKDFRYIGSVMTTERICTITAATLVKISKDVANEERMVRLIEFWEGLLSEFTGEEFAISSNIEFHNSEKKFQTLLNSEEEFKSYRDYKNRVFYKDLPEEYKKMALSKMIETLKVLQEKLKVEYDNPIVYKDYNTFLLKKTDINKSKKTGDVSGNGVYSSNIIPEKGAKDKVVSYLKNPNGKYIVKYVTDEDGVKIRLTYNNYPRFRRYNKESIKESFFNMYKDYATVTYRLPDLSDRIDLNSENIKTEDVLGIDLNFNADNILATSNPLSLYGEEPHCEFSGLEHTKTKKYDKSLREIVNDNNSANYIKNQLLSGNNVLDNYQPKSIYDTYKSIRRLRKNITPLEYLDSLKNRPVKYVTDKGVGEVIPEDAVLEFRDCVVDGKTVRKAFYNNREVSNRVTYKRPYKYVTEDGVGDMIPINASIEFRDITVDDEVITKAYYNGKEVTNEYHVKADKGRTIYARNEVKRTIRQVLKNAKESGYKIIAVEKINGVANRKEKKNYFRHLFTFTTFKDYLVNLGYKMGLVVVEVNPKDTSKTCRSCGHISKQNREGREFKCVKCGYTTKADLNAALNIRDRALTGIKKGEALKV